ncbi:MFS transporter [Pseudomonas aeruginosa]|nr:MFS transporter [Pseudomonas aeruginosa]
MPTPDKNNKNDVQAFIDAQAVSAFQLRVLSLCFLIVAMDGFDTAAIGFIAPALAHDWQLSPAQLSPILGAALAGLALGAFAAGPLADRFGRKSVLLLSVLFFGGWSLASAYAGSVETLALLRFLTGLGLGGAMPNAITLTSEYCPRRHRALMVTAMFCGFTLGSALGGLLAARMVPALGWESVLLLAAADADEAFWQREWALRRCRAESLPRVLSSPRLRRHAFQLFAPPRWPMRSLLDWAPAHLPLEPQCALVLLEQLIDAVRALQRRGVQGLWLAPRQILLDEGGRLLFLPEAAAILPGVARQALPADSVPLAPELRRGEALDGRADQFALAALFYWLLCGRWPSIACPESDGGCRYEPLGERQADLPVGWDGVLARALAPRPEARFEALSEFWLALQKPLAHPQRVFAPRRLQRGVLALVLLLAGAALLVGLAG